MAWNMGWHWENFDVKTEMDMLLVKTVDYLCWRDPDLHWSFGPCNCSIYLERMHVRTMSISNWDDLEYWFNINVSKAVEILLREEIINYIVEEWGFKRIGRKNILIDHDEFDGYSNVYKVIVKSANFIPTPEQEAEFHEYTDTHDAPYRWFKLVEVE